MKVPKRVQRKRSKGSKNPANTKYVGRPGVWGNPYPVDKYGIEESLRLYEIHIRKKIKAGELDIEELRTYENLSCWCSLASLCHVDILIKILKE